MNGPRPVYRRLPGYHRFLLGHVTLWLGADHLLLVRLRGYSEAYERLYFRDIQAITIRVTDTWSLWGGVLALFTVPTTILAWIAESTPARVGWGLAAGALFLGFLLNLLRGQSCACHLRTPLRVVELPSLRRLRVARRVLARLRPLLEAVQGSFDAGAAQARLLTETPPPLPAAVTTGVARLIVRPLRRDNGRAHEILWLLLVLDTILTVFQIGPEATLLNVAALVLLLVEFGFAVAAVTRQKDSDLDPGLKRFAWVTLSYLCVMTLVGLGISTIHGIRQALNPGRVTVDPSSPELQMIALVSAGLLSLWGLVLIRSRREAVRRQSWSIHGT